MGLYDNLRKTREEAIAQARAEAQKGKKKSPDVAKQKPGVAPKLAATQKKSADHVRRTKGAVEKLRGDKEKLYGYWSNNNPKGKIEVLESDAKYLALKEIDNALMKKEAYLLLSLIEKYWSREEAMKQYKACWKGEKFYMKKLSSFFSKANAGPKMGIYFGTRTITWSPDLKWHQNINIRNWWGRVASFKVTGWWAVDADEPTGNVSTHTGKQDFKKILANIKGDEFLGKYLLKSLKNVRKELMTSKGKIGYNDSGLSPAQEKEVTEFIEKAEGEARGFSRDKIKKDLFKWFKKQPSNNWISLDKKRVNQMCYLFGATCGRYLYRVTNDRIYAIGITGEQTDSRYGKGSYIEIKNNKLERWIGGKDSEDAKKMLKKELLGQMTPAEIKTEINKYKARLEKSPSREALLAPTKNSYVRVFKNYKKRNKFVKHSRLKEDFYEKYEKALKTDLMKKNKNYSEDDATRYAAIRVEEIKKGMNKAMEGTVMDAVKQNNEVKLLIEMDSDGKVSITLKDKKLRDRLKDAAKAAAKKGTDIKDIAQEQYESFIKKLGPIGKFFGKFFDFKKQIFNYLKTGKKGWALSIAGMVFGAEVSRRALNSKSISSLAQLEKLSKVNGGVTKKRLRFKGDVKLTGYKIVVPKGKGIRPGSTFKVELKGVKGKVDADPKKAKREKSKQQKGLGIFGGLGGGFLAGRGKRVNMFKDNEITIAANTEIPAKTYIPKGAKIMKT